MSPVCASVNIIP